MVVKRKLTLKKRVHPNDAYLTEMSRRPAPEPPPPPRPFARQIEQMEQECGSGYMGEHLSSALVRLNEPTTEVRCCGRCHALVEASRFDDHVTWHVQLEVGR